MAFLHKPFFSALLLAVFLACPSAVFAADKPRLAILPFSGGKGTDGEKIVGYFSADRGIQAFFTPVTPNGEAEAIIAETRFLMIGYTDSDLIARLGRLLDADFVLSGHIFSLGDRDIVITTLIDVQTLELLGGDCREYTASDIYWSRVAELSRKMIAFSRRDTSGLPGLTLAPFHAVNEKINQHDIGVMVQILAVEFANSGIYTVLPRMSAIYNALDGLGWDASAGDEAVTLGRAVGAEYVLNTKAEGTDSAGRLTAWIYRADDGNRHIGYSVDWQDAGNGIRIMTALARRLSGFEDDENPQPSGFIAQAGDSQSAQTPEAGRIYNWNDDDRLWSFGISAGTSFSLPWVIATLNGTLSPLPFSFLEIGFDLGLVSGVKDGYYSFYPFVRYALFIPFTLSLSQDDLYCGWYAGAGGGFMYTGYDFPEGKNSYSVFTLDVATGFIIGDVFNISYSFRTNFNDFFNHKLSLGYMYRFM